MKERERERTRRGAPVRGYMWAGGLFRIAGSNRWLAKVPPPLHSRLYYIIPYIYIYSLKKQKSKERKSRFSLFKISRIKKNNLSSSFRSRRHRVFVVPSIQRVYAIWNGHHQNSSTNKNDRAKKRNRKRIEEEERREEKRLVTPATTRVLNSLAVHYRTRRAKVWPYLFLVGAISYFVECNFSASYYSRLLLGACFLLLLLLPFYLGLCLHLDFVPRLPFSFFLSSSTATN